MTITSLDQAVTLALAPVPFLKNGSAPKAAGTFVDLWAAGGAPTPGAFSSSLNGAVLTNVTQGGLLFSNPSSDARVLKFGAMSTQTGALMLVDRVWQNGGFTITTTTSQAITTPTIPRDRVNSNNGSGLVCALEVSATTGNGAVTNTTLAYTGDDGNSGTATIPSFLAAASTGSLVPFSWDATKQHNGIRAISGLTLGTTYVSGTVNLVIYRPIAVISLATANVWASADLATLGFPSIWSGSVLDLIWMPTGTTAPILSGLFIETTN